MTCFLIKFPLPIDWIDGSDDLVVSMVSLEVCPETVVTLDNSAVVHN